MDSTTGDASYRPNLPSDANQSRTDAFFRIRPHAHDDDLAYLEDALIRILVVMEYVPIDPQAIASALRHAHRALDFVHPEWLDGLRDVHATLIERASTPDDITGQEVAN